MIVNKYIMSETSIYIDGSKKIDVVDLSDYLIKKMPNNNISFHCQIKDVDNQTYIIVKQYTDNITDIYSNVDEYISQYLNSKGILDAIIT